MGTCQTKAERHYAGAVRKKVKEYLKYMEKLEADGQTHGIVDRPSPSIRDDVEKVLLENYGYFVYDMDAPKPPENVVDVDRVVVPDAESGGKVWKISCCELGKKTSPQEGLSNYFVEINLKTTK